jgi:hypothetical protein
MPREQLASSVLTTGIYTTPPVMKIDIKVDRLRIIGSFLKDEFREHLKIFRK